MTFRTRRVGLAVGLAAAVVALNMVGVLRYPGGPLRDPSDDGPLWLDLRPADRGSSTVGNTQPSDWAIGGRSYDFGLLTVTHPRAGEARVEHPDPADGAVEAPLGPRPGFRQGSMLHAGKLLEAHVFDPQPSPFVQ